MMILNIFGFLSELFYQQTANPNLRSTSRFGQYPPPPHRIAVYFNRNFISAPINDRGFYLVGPHPLNFRIAFSKIKTPRRKCVSDGSIFLFLKDSLCEHPLDSPVKLCKTRYVRKITLTFFLRIFLFCLFRKVFSPSNTSIICTPEMFVRRPKHRKSRPGVQFAQFASNFQVPAAKSSVRLPPTVRLAPAFVREEFQYV